MPKTYSRKRRNQLQHGRRNRIVIAIVIFGVLAWGSLIYRLFAGMTHG